MRLLNQLFTFLSGVIVLTALAFGVANANNEYAMDQAQQSSAIETMERPAMETASMEKAAALARAEALARAAAIAKANAYKARVEAIKKTEAYEKIKAELKK
ncbi:hypothetical protein [Psychrobacter sp.]|uniref:hypothetical protein n=1 Tax=unclassified Psychrobacter TaxID=196806 RepID=UPI003F9A4FD6